MVETDLPFQDVEVAMTRDSFSLSPLPLAFRHTLEAEERSQLLAELVEAITGHVHEVSTFPPFSTKHLLPSPPSPSSPLTVSPLHSLSLLPPSSAGCEA